MIRLARLRALEIGVGLAILQAVAGAGFARAEDPTPAQYLKDAASLYENGYFFRAARYAFAAAEFDGEGSLRPHAYAWIAQSLLRAGQENAAAYFFIRTLQTNDKGAIRSVLRVTEPLLAHVGADLLRKYLIRHTQYADYDARALSAYLYALGKDALLSGEAEKAVGYLSSVAPSSRLWPYALQLRGTANALLGRKDKALADFETCVSSAGDIPQIRGRANEEEDLRSRCQASVARVLYEMDRFDDADRAYDQISKQSFVWPDILFEQAWNGFARGEFNRSLGKLVSYKSPALQFVYNSEVDVLRAQSFLALCIVSDANDAINDFNSRYTGIGQEVKRFVEGNASRLDAFYELGRAALRAPLWTDNPTYRLANRFIRGPYFQNLVAQEREIATERRAVQQQAPESVGEGFAGFLEEVLDWRLRSVRMLGGAFVKNSLIDYHRSLLADFDKMSFIKLEMLKRAKDALMKRTSAEGEERGRGNVLPTRRDDQYRWGFNGEFWNDELGDYVFGLESECR